MREKIIEKLIERGYNASAIDTVKNGVVWHGIVIKEENKSMAPVIYLDDLDGQHDLEESVSYVIAVYEKHRDFVLHHKSFSNHVSVDLICLSFANVIFSHLTGFDGVQHTHLVKLSNKVSNKVVTVVCR